MREAGLALIALGIMIAAAAGMALVKTGDASSGQETTTTTQPPQPPGGSEQQLCDVYKEVVSIQDPDPPGMDYYDGYLVIHVINPCDVVDVAVYWDYVPPRPMTTTSVYFEVYFNDTLIYVGPATVVDFNDYEWNGKTVVVTVKALSG